MATDNKNVTDTPLTIRERMTIHILIMLIKVIKPMGWSHEIDNALKPVLEEMANETRA